MWHKGYDENLHHKQGDDLKGCSAPVKDNIVPKHEANRAQVVFKICFIHERINLYLPIWRPLPHSLGPGYEFGYNENSVIMNRFLCIKLFDCNDKKVLLP